jgi:hypothetical protein
MIKVYERIHPMLSNSEITTISYFGMKQVSFDEARRNAGFLFNLAYGRAIRRSLWAKLTGRSNALQTLSNYTSATQSHRSTRVATVSIDLITGSEGRSLDFDAGFNPLRMLNRERWMSILIARRMDTPLPPVELIQVGRNYFVRDGHHRISVAKAMGQLDIEAVIVN